MATYNYAIGHIRWAKVLGDPVPNYNRDGHEWTFDFIPNGDAAALFKDLKIAGKMKEGKDGTKFMRFTQKARRADGKANDPITVVDARNRPWDPDVKIGNDSLAEVKFKVVDYGKGLQTMGIYPQALRILEHKEFVRQEFEPLPDDSEYVKNFSDDQFFEVVEDASNDVPFPEGDPLE